MKYKQMLDRLVENALDFFECSVADFDDAPKYSVMEGSFWHGCVGCDGKSGHDRDKDD